MTDNIINFVLYWGIWLLVPIIIDGLTTLVYLVGVWWMIRQHRNELQVNTDPFYPPLATVIIPVYNGRRTLPACLESIRLQNYPQECLQIIAVNNQSTDDSFHVFQEVQSRPFEGSMLWVDTHRQGKVWALNAGIHLAHGSLIINVDCDTVLHPDAIKGMALAFHNEPDLAAATGAIEVMAMDQSHLPPWRRLWGGCEALEYLEAFNIGRQYQTATNSIFTLAGAFSAFRREILLQTFLYDQQTVSEDTKMTLDIRDRMGSKMRIACVPEAVAYVEPTQSMSKLYAQRLRWQRGEMEVAALQEELHSSHVFRVQGFSMPRTLIIDHTVAFPRLVWTFLIVVLYFFGYPLPLIINAYIGIYVFYAVMEGSCMVAAYGLGDDVVKDRIKHNWYLWVLMPIYRYVIFWCRFAGFLNVLTEDAQWRVSDPWEETRVATRELAEKVSLVYGKQKQRLPKWLRRQRRIRRVPSEGSLPGPR